MGAYASLQPLEREATSSLIAAGIRQRIVDGTFPQGMQLGEAQLAGRLGVSRGPVREAMQRLIQEGLLRTERHRGVFVITLDEDDVADIYLARNAIERATATRLIARSRRDVIAQLETIVGRMDEAAAAQAWPSLMDLDLEFHRTFVESAGSKRLTRMFQSLLVETRLCLSELDTAYPSPDEAVAEHRSLLDTLRGGELASLIATLDAHHQHALSHLQAGRRTGPSTPQGPSAAG